MGRKRTKAAIKIWGKIEKMRCLNAPTITGALIYKLVLRVWQFFALQKMSNHMSDLNWKCSDILSDGLLEIILSLGPYKNICTHLMVCFYQDFILTKNKNMDERESSSIFFLLYKDFHCDIWRFFIVIQYTGRLFNLFMYVLRGKSICVYDVINLESL